MENIFNFQSIIGLSSGLSDIFRVVKSVAPYNVNILIQGETGTGKELLAELIHSLSPCFRGRMVKINCAALPENLLESELFGYEKGAFTGAVDRKKGKIELAHKGTLFLDEIGDMSLTLQAKLLRVLQSKEISRIGGLDSWKVDFHLVTATNCELMKAVQENRFREDLFYRISSFPITVPSLRRRKEDIPALVSFFIRKFETETNLKKKEITETAMELLVQHNWPGNIRELENIVLQSMVLAVDEPVITKEIVLPLLGEKYSKGYREAIQEIMFSMIQNKIDLRDINRDIVNALMVHYDYDVKAIEQQTTLSRDRIYRYRRQYPPEHQDP